MLDQVEPSPLVCGYVVDSDGVMTELAWGEMDEALAGESCIVWLHLNQADARARTWVRDCARIPEPAKAILRGTDSHMRVEPAGKGLAGIVGDLHHEFAGKGETLEVLRLYLDNRCLVSMRRQPLKGIDKLRRSIGEGLKVERPVGLVVQFLHHVTDTLGDLMLELAESIDSIEEAILADELGGESQDLARVRRVAARLRRHMVPQQHALLGLLSRLPAWIEPDDSVALRTAIERLGALGHDLDLVQERARLLQEQISNRLMENTNRNLYTLSIVTTIFLPITLISGIFGMNLGGLPWLQDPFGFWYGIVIMVLVAGLTLYVLRRRAML